MAPPLTRSGLTSVISEEISIQDSEATTRVLSSSLATLIASLMTLPEGRSIAELWITGVRFLCAGVRSFLFRALRAFVIS